METYYVTRAGKEKLFAEYQKVLQRKAEVQKEMGECAETDTHLSENPVFQELRVLSMYDLPRRAQELRDKYNSAVIIEEQSEYINFDGTHVIMGTKVTYRDNGREESFQILGEDEGDFKERKIGCKAPLALAMLGHFVGEIISFRDRIIEIVSVERI